jgi:3-dehydroquinate dehydratase type I
VIGGLHLGHAPCLVATALADSIDGMLVQTRRAIASGADMVELRVDRLADAECVRDVIQLAACPHIVACRSPHFGGFFAGTEEERVLRLEAAVLAGAACVDIEFFTEPDLRSRLIGFAHERGVPLLIGYEDMKGTPDRAALIQGLHDSGALGPDLVKLAVRAHSHADLLTVLQVALEARSFLDVPYAAIALGPHGAPSRPLACVLGASFTYCAVEAGAVPGQLTIKETRDMIDALSEQRWTCSSS